MLDLSQVGSSGSETCPWHYLGDTVSRAAGGLYYSPDDKRFRTVDGREDLGSGWRDSTTNLLIDTTVPGVRTLVDPGSVPSNFFAVAALEGSPVCTSTYLECRCFDEASCGGLPDETALSAWQLGVPFGQEFSLRRAVCEPRGSWASNADLACLPTIQSSGDPSQCDIQCEDDAVGLLDGCLAGPFCAGFSPSGAGFVTNSRVLNRRGLHGVGFASDPLSGIAFSYGGSAGCTELGCGDTELTFEGTDLIVAISTLDLANTAGLLTSWSSSMGDFSIDEAWQDQLEPLSDGTIGVRGAAIAVTGFGDFDLLNKSFVTPPTEIAMWGGSFHQEVVPESRYEVGGAFAEVGAWARWEQLEDSDPESHLLPGAFKFRVVNLTTGGIQDLSGVENAGVFEAAAVGLPGRRVATLGGVLDTGNLVEQLLVLNTATGNSVASFAGVPMLAPGGGHDPLGRSAIFVGSAPGDSFVTVQYVDAPELESAPKVEVDAAVDRVSYQLSFDDLGSPDSYTQETVSEFVIRCPEGTTRCWTDTVRIRVPDRTDFASIEATLELPSGSLPLRVADGDRTANNSEFVGVLLESPVSLVGATNGADGYVLRVTATVNPPEIALLTVAEFAQEDQDGRVQWTRVPAGGVCSETRRLSVGGLHFLPASADLDLVIAPSAVSDLRVVHPAGWSPVFGGSLQECGPGELDLSLDGVFSTARAGAQATCLRVGDQVNGRLSIDGKLEVMEQVATGPVLGPFTIQAPSTQIAVQVYVDQCVDSAVTADFIDRYVGGNEPYGGGTLAEDSRSMGRLQGLSEAALQRFGLFVGRGPLPPEAQVGAQASAGVIRLFNFGLPDGREEFDVRGDLVHELAHFWASRPQADDEESRWLVESIPELVRAELVPESARTMHFDGLALRIAAFQHEGDQQPAAALRNLEFEAEPDGGFRRNYRAGAYILRQAFAYSDDPWSEWKALQLQVADEGPRFTVEDSSELFDALTSSALAPGQFYDARVKGEEGTEPVLGLDIQGDSANSVKLKQVQAGWLNESGQPLGISQLALPFLLGCEAGDGQPLPGCLAMDGTASTVRNQMIVVPDSGVDISLDALVGTGFPPMASQSGEDPDRHIGKTRWALYANHLVPLRGPYSEAGVVALQPPEEWLVVDGMSRGGLATEAFPPSPTWLTRCDPVLLGTSEACGQDRDGDGAYEFGDCDDASPLRAPGAVDPVQGSFWEESSLDLNCDGWPSSVILELSMGM